MQHLVVAMLPGGASIIEYNATAGTCRVRWWLDDVVVWLDGHFLASIIDGLARDGEHGTTAVIESCMKWRAWALTALTNDPGLARLVRGIGLTVEPKPTAG